MFSRIASKGLTRPLDWLWPDVGLRTKISVLVIAGTLSLIALFVHLGKMALDQSTERILHDRVVLAQATASQIDNALAEIENIVRDAVAREGWSNPDQVQVALAQTRVRLGMHATHLFLTDDTGRVITSTPAIPSPLDLSQFSAVAQALDGQPFAVSGYKRTLSSFSSAVAASPIQNSSGDVTRALVVSLNLEDSHYLSFIRSAELGNGGYVDLVDQGGRVLVSTCPARVDRVSDSSSDLSTLILEHRSVASTGHSCYTSPAENSCREVLAFAPLDHAPWGVAVRQREDQVFAGLHNLLVQIFGLMLICIAGDLIFVYLTTRAVIRPVNALTAASRRIAAGDLETPVPTDEKDELGRLARTFEQMRLRLQQWSRALKKEAQDATAASRATMKQNAMLYAELQEKEQMRRELLHRVFSAQEEERKRISRELHDETCQILNSLAYDLDNVGEMLAHGESPATEVQPMLEKMRALAKTGRDGVSRIIFDLRPTMLDHLGLVPALRWYAETRLSDMKINYSFREVGQARRLRPSVETALFRVVQEAVNNIAQHSRARHADFCFEYCDDRLVVRVADDGQGFDRTSIPNRANGRRGLGLMGMEERMTAAGGHFILQTACGKGTVIQLSVPLTNAPGANHEQDPSPRSG